MWGFEVVVQAPVAFTRSTGIRRTRRMLAGPVSRPAPRTINKWSAHACLVCLCSQPLSLTSTIMNPQWLSSKSENSISNAVVDVPSELKPLKLCIFKRLLLHAVNSNCPHMRSRHADLLSHDEEHEIALAGRRSNPACQTQLWST